MSVTYLRFNILRVLLTPKYCRVDLVPYENSQHTNDSSMTVIYLEFNILQVLLTPKCCNVRSHIQWRREQVSVRTLGLEEAWIVRSHIGWRREQNILYKGVETSSQQKHFKNIERKPKEDNIVVSLDSYKWYQSQTLGLEGG